MDPILLNAPSLTVFGAIAWIIITALNNGKTHKAGRSWQMTMTVFGLLAIMVVTIVLRGAPS